MPGDLEEAPRGEDRPHDQDRRRDRQGAAPPRARVHRGQGEAARQRRRAAGPRARRAHLQRDQRPGRRRSGGRNGARVDPVQRRGCAVDRQSHARKHPARRHRPEEGEGPVAAGERGVGPFSAHPALPRCARPRAGRRERAAQYVDPTRVTASAAGQGSGGRSRDRRRAAALQRAPVARRQARDAGAEQRFRRAAGGGVPGDDRARCLAGASDRCGVRPDQRAGEGRGPLHPVADGRRSIPDANLPRSERRPALERHRSRRGRARDRAVRGLEACDVVELPAQARAFVPGAELRQGRPGSPRGARVRYGRAGRRRRAHHPGGDPGLPDELPAAAHERQLAARRDPDAAQHGRDPVHQRRRAGVRHRLRPQRAGVQLPPRTSSSAGCTPNWS